MRIKQFDLGYLAGIIDGEGSFNVEKGKPAKFNPYRRGRIARLTVQMNNESTIKKIQSIIGNGSVYHCSDGSWGYHLSANGLRRLLPLIKDKLIVTKQQANLMLKFLKLVKRNGRYTPEEDIKLEEIRLKISEINRRE